MKISKTLRWAGLIGWSLGAFGGATVAAEEVVVYSARKEHLIKPVFDRFTKATGVKVTYLTDGEAPLMAKLQAEGERTKADVFMTVDAGNLWQAARADLLQPIDSKVLKENIPAHLRDPNGLWYGFSVRARTIAYNPTKVKAGELSTYADLADPKWKGRLCLRTAKKVYNQSLVAMFLAEYGEAKTETIVKGWVDNLATKVFSDDTAVLKALASGKCHVGIVNTYYFGNLKKDQPDVQVALFWPDQSGSGVHVNVSGAGMTKHAKNRAGAVKLLEWLSSTEAQRLFVDVNMEYPANAKVPPSPAVQSWGAFKQNMINVTKAGELQATAIKLMDRARYQ